MSIENKIETDVLISGGMAGCFAAIKAKEKGVDVTLVDKGYVGRSGQTPFAGTFSVFNSEWGHDLDVWMEHINTVGEYVNNRTWTEIGFKDSYDRFQDLVSYGVDITRDEDGEILRHPPRFGPCQAIHLGWRDFARVLRRQAVKSGVKIMDRIMVTDLLKQDGKIVGAVGIPMDSDDLCVFKAKATVMSAGAGGFKPPGWPISELTSDADTMAYRAGAEITGKEYCDPHSTSAEYPGHFGHIMKNGRPIFGRMVNAEGDEVRGIGTLFLNLEFEAHAGRAPIVLEGKEGERITRIGGGSSGMSVHKSEGIWPAGKDCSTSLPGLFAAGDSLGTMQSGAVYAAIGMALSGAAVTGARAGWGAADYAMQAEKPEMDNDMLSELKKSVYVPLDRKGGFSPGWVTQQLQNIMIPYFIMYIKKEDRMQAALTLVEFLRDHLVPKLTAKDTHELRLAHETRNMVLNAEMRLRSSIFRTESRGCHYREDYPRRDDPDWLAWVLLKEEKGRMTVLKKPVPKKWWPDLSTPYKERYSTRLPGE
ncbi:MAG: FAD-binding protein [Deltaproteobacteria bacterium]|nr:FAD-binding protein [Deltaproteobacteria bacterium]